MCLDRLYEEKKNTKVSLMTPGHLTDAEETPLNLTRPQDLNSFVPRRRKTETKTAIALNSMPFLAKGYTKNKSYHSTSGRIGIPQDLIDLLEHFNSLNE
ncbi:hypothetical protein TNIN_195201 [Trichonephila inaurata madagascariensis]|uniref:Uncharacterized protein n=1 Tax=Trichonephila inaurata madagascariensis TaxID=2747483 RepID=A0A8X7CMR3_9ARAC|nr:hypothetical protein TNIN_195201 [Trichonephila inaurata madagascariensis]